MRQVLSVCQALSGWIHFVGWGCFTCLLAWPPPPVLQLSLALRPPLHLLPVVSLLRPWAPLLPLLFLPLPPWVRPHPPAAAACLPATLGCRLG